MLKPSSFHHSEEDVTAPRKQVAETQANDEVDGKAFNNVGMTDDDRGGVLRMDSSAT